MLRQLDEILSQLHQCKFFVTIQKNIHICNSSSDINPILQAANAVLELHRAGSDTARCISLHDFFLGHRRVAMANDEVLVTVRLSLPDSSNKCFLRSYKQAHRRDDSKGIVSAGFMFNLNNRIRTINNGILFHRFFHLVVWQHQQL